MSIIFLRNSRFSVNLSISSSARQDGCAEAVLAICRPSRSILPCLSVDASPYLFLTRFNSRWQTMIVRSTEKCVTKRLLAVPTDWVKGYLDADALELSSWEGDYSFLLMPFELVLRVLRMLSTRRHSARKAGKKTRGVSEPNKSCSEQPLPLGLQKPYSKRGIGRTARIEVRRTRIQDNLVILFCSTQFLSY